MDSFQVVADFPLDGVATEANLAKKFEPKSEGVTERSRQYAFRFTNPFNTVSQRMRKSNHGVQWVM